MQVRGKTRAQLALPWAASSRHDKNESMVCFRGAYGRLKRVELFRHRSRSRHSSSAITAKTTTATRSAWTARLHAYDSVVDSCY